MPSVIWGADNQSISSGLKKMSDIYNQRIKPQYLKTIEKNKHILPLTRIIEKLNKTGTVGDNNFFIFEEDEIPQSVQLLASQPTTTDTDLVMTASDMIKAIKVGHIMPPSLTACASKRPVFSVRRFLTESNLVTT